METETRDQDGVSILKLSGHVSASEIDALITELNNLKEAPGARCVLDTTLLKNLPTTVIGALMALIRHLEQAGGRLVLAAPDATVRVSLDRLGVSPMLAITESLDEATAILREEESSD
jgi:anti-anti-sigma factor